MNVRSKVYPSIPFDSPLFKPTRGADVQATWRRFGWTPIANEQPAPIPAPEAEPEVHAKPPTVLMRRAK